MKTESQFEIIEGYPNPYIFNDGRRVETVEDWKERAKELKDMYEKYMYGYWRSGEKVTYGISDTGAMIFTFFGPKEAEGAKNMTLKVSANGRETSFDVAVYLPDVAKCTMPEGGWPYIVCMHPIPAQQYALDHGYAVIVVNTMGIASDNMEHKGNFYDLYPYTDNPSEQTGVLAAWGWGCAKVLDAMYAGAAAELDINADNSIVTGVSRWGKATAVCGMFEKRFRMVVPSCSGAGGLALYRYISEGKTYDFSTKEAPSEYAYSKNEPLDCLQSEAERGWFNDEFLNFKSPWSIPLEQYELAAMCADPDRYYFIIGSCISEDWVNAPAMWACFKAAESIYDFLGLGDRIICNIHKEGHAVIDEDMMYLIQYFNKVVYGIEPEADMSKVKTSVFELGKNRDASIDDIYKNWR